MIDFILLLLLAAAVVIIAIRWRRNVRSGRHVENMQPDQTVGLTPAPPFETEHNMNEELLAPPKRGILPFSVLIVDDQPAIRMLLRELFELEGVTVFEAAHGRMAIEQVRREAIDFILLDLKMPDMDGIDALRQIRSFNNKVKVAMITAYGDPDKLEAARELGTLAFFTKPFDIESVKEFVMSRLAAKKENNQGAAL